MELPPDPTGDWFYDQFAQAVGGLDADGSTELAYVATQPAPPPSNTIPLPPSPPPSRRRMTRIACRECQQRKTKCSGTRPACVRCQKHGRTCKYDVAEQFMTRMESLKRGNQCLGYRVQLLDDLIYKLKTCTDWDASELLARLRLGEEVEALAGHSKYCQSSTDAGGTTPIGSRSHLPSSLPLRCPGGLAANRHGDSAQEYQPRSPYHLQGHFEMAGDLLVEPNS